MSYLDYLLKRLRQIAQGALLGRNDIFLAHDVLVQINAMLSIRDEWRPDPRFWHGPLLPPDP